MDREILFRGKSAYNDVWEYGSLVRGTISMGTWDSSHKIVSKAPHIAPGMIFFTGVKPKTIGQYTGLNYGNTVNGRKMFEGDVFRRGIFLYVIKVDSYNGFRFMVELADGSGLGAVMLTKTDAEYGEYVGNIHDNPELIGGG